MWSWWIFFVPEKYFFFPSESYINVTIKFHYFEKKTVTNIKVKQIVMISPLFSLCLVCLFCTLSFLIEGNTCSSHQLYFNYLPQYIVYGKLKTRSYVFPSEVIFVKWPTLSRSDWQSLLKTHWSPEGSTSSVFSSCFPNIPSRSSGR